MDNWEGIKNVRIPHILRTLVNFLVFLDSDFFRKSFHHLQSVRNLFKQHPSHMMSQKVLKPPKKWLGCCLNRFVTLRNVRIPHIFCTLVKFFVFLDLDFSGNHFTTFEVQRTYLNDIQAIWCPKKILKTPKKWRIGWVRRMWGFLTFFAPSQFSTCF